MKETDKVVRDCRGRFAPGQSGNKAGRPKRTEAEQEIIDSMVELVPGAVDVLRQTLADDNAPDYLRLRAAEIVLERVAGKPMTALELDQLATNRQAEELFGFALI